MRVLTNLAAKLCMAATVACTLVQPAGAAPVAPAVKAEIHALLVKIESGACQFNRNGTWYDAAAAKSHLLRKLDYLEGKNAVQTTEQFIALGAASSSSSGKAYQVKCGAAPAVDSKSWLMAQLQTIRSGK